MANLDLILEKDTRGNPQYWALKIGGITQASVWNAENEELAHLLHGACDLLKALEEMLWFIPACGCGLDSCNICSPNKTIGKARAAVRKARGESEGK